MQRPDPATLGEGELAGCGWEGLKKFLLVIWGLRKAQRADVDLCFCAGKDDAIERLSLAGGALAEQRGREQRLWLYLALSMQAAVQQF